MSWFLGKRLSVWLFLGFCSVCMHFYGPSGVFWISGCGILAQSLQSNASYICGGFGESSLLLHHGRATVAFWAEWKCHRLFCHLLAVRDSRYYWPVPVIVKKSYLSLLFPICKLWYIYIYIYYTSFCSLRCEQRLTWLSHHVSSMLRLSCNREQYWTYKSRFLSAPKCRWQWWRST